MFWMKKRPKFCEKASVSYASKLLPLKNKDSQIAPAAIELEKRVPKVSKNCSNCAKSSHLVTLGRDKWGCLTDDLIIALVSSHHERCPFVNITCVEVGFVRQKEQKAFNGVLKSC